MSRSSDGGDDKGDDDDFGKDCVVSCSCNVTTEVAVEFCSSDEPTLASLAMDNSSLRFLFSNSSWASRR